MALIRWSERVPHERGGLDVLNGKPWRSFPRADRFNALRTPPSQQIYRGFQGISRRIDLDQARRGWPAGTIQASCEHNGEGQ